MEALLDQSDYREYTTAELESLWQAGNQVGDDRIGHGTHVATIAAGSQHLGHEGVAPGARLLLVKTNFEETDDAVEWIFRKANGRPTVVNLSLGSHFGAHDGSGPEERFHQRIVGPRKLIVASAGNDRERRIHLGFESYESHVEEVLFDITRPADSSRPECIIQCWTAPEDSFQISVLSPDGTMFPLPDQGQLGPFWWGRSEIYFACKPDPITGDHCSQVQIVLARDAEDTDRLNWRLRITCRRAIYGRFDAWIALSSMASFQSSRIVDPFCTVCMPATGPACIAVGSYTSKNAWGCDQEPQRRQDVRAVLGRISRFSGSGPSRDGRCKPEIAAPGEYVAAALAPRSRYASFTDRSLASDLILTLAGTSMSAPVVTGVLALCLQKRPDLDPTEARRVLINTARHDRHTRMFFDPVLGHGKVDARAALASL